MDMLHNDESLCEWLRYTYNEMTSNRFMNRPIEDIVNHYRINGFSDDRILEYAKMAHGTVDYLPILA